MNRAKSHTGLMKLLKERFPNAGIGSQPKEVKTRDHEDGLILSASPNVTPIAPIYITVNTVQELKELGGVPDSMYNTVSDEHAMPKMSADQLINASRRHPDFCKALTKYIYGNSAQLDGAFVSLLNAKRFPMTIALYAGEDLVITKDHPLIIDDPHHNPVTVSYGKITMEQGAQIICKTYAALACDQLNASESCEIINLGGNGGNGGPGGNGGDSGSKSSNGGDGKEGAPGQDGGSASSITIDFQDITGKTITLKTLGGNGGNGGAGGKGGKGGSSAKGGKGGNGGNGGDGGNGGSVIVNYRGDEGAFNTNSTGGAGGAGGAGGTGGNGGDGSGTTGTGGTAGKGGSPGKIEIHRLG